MTAAARPARRARTGDRFVYGGLAILVFGGVWEAVGVAGLVDEKFLATPSEALRAGWDLAASGTLWAQSWVSFQEFFWGTLVGVVVGVALGFLMAQSSKVNAAVGPTVWAVYAVPRTAFVPLLLVWFGLGISSKAALVFLGVVFPMIANTYLGVRSTDAYALRAARSFSAGRREIMQKVILPASIPYLVDGLRLGTGRGLVGVIVAELYVSNAGIGFLIRQASLNFNTAVLIFGVLFVAAFGIVLSQGLIWLERRYAGWRRAGTGA